MADRPSSRPIHVLIAGGGFAALEAALALRALAADRVRLTLVSPDPTFLYRPMATVEAFTDVTPRSYDLRAISGELRATYRRGRLESVAPRKKQVRLASGARLYYDALILATGARAIASVPGALTFRDQRDLPLFRALLQELDAGALDHLVFALPSGCSWPLPLYELALLSAAHARRGRLKTTISLVSPEREPLEMFRPEASRVVSDLLSERGIRFLGNAVATSVCRDGSLALAFQGSIRADRVVATPELRGRRITGVPASWWGFVPTDVEGRVEGLEDVYAAGDLTTFPIKQGSLAAQQADRIGHAIAAALGAPVKEFRATHVVRARLLGGARPLLLRAELDSYGRSTTATLEQPESESVADSTKVVGRYLTPYLEGAVARAPRPAPSPRAGG